MIDSEEFNLYLANLEEFVFDENKIVTVGWLSRTLDINVGLAKNLLSTFTNDESFKSKLATCWFLYGSNKSDTSSRKMLIVPGNQLDSAKDGFDKITSQHVYSIQKSGDTDINSVFLADQSAEKTIAQCSSLSSIKCDQVKIVANRRNLVNTVPSTTPITSKPTTAGKSVAKPEDKFTGKSADSVKKSPVKNTIGSMFGKKNDDNEKKKQDANKSKEASEKSKKESEKAPKESDKSTENKEAAKKSPGSPGKKSTTVAGKKKGAEKGAGSANIASFFSKGPLPPMKKVEPTAKTSTKSSEEVKVEPEKEIKEEPKKKGKQENEKSNKKANKKASKEIQESDDEAMDVEEIDENVEPIKVKENTPKESKTKEKAIKETKSKSKKTSNKTDAKKKEKKEKKEKETRRQRIRVFSDSSESDQDEEASRERSVSPPPPSPPRVKASLSDDEDEVIPPTPEPTSTGGRKRKRKLVTKTMTDESGFLRTVKEFETVSCSDSEGESKTVQQDSKKQKVEGETKAKSPSVQKSATKLSPSKSKQTSILSFFKKST